MVSFMVPLWYLLSFMVPLWHRYGTILSFMVSLWYLYSNFYIFYGTFIVSLYYLSLSFMVPLWIKVTMKIRTRSKIH